MASPVVVPSPGFVSGTGLALAGVVVPAPDVVDRKLSSLLGGRRDALHILLDFDRTCSTHYFAPGVRGASCHGVVEHRWTGEALRRRDEINDKYYPIEIGPLPVEEKIPFMESWYKDINKVIVESRVSRAEIEELAESAPLRLREGVAELLSWAVEHSVPVTIFSAGITDVAEAVLRKKWRPVLPASLRVISNRMRFESDDPAAPVVGFGPVLHMFNKNFSFLSETDPEWAALVARRRHVVLVGDGLGDAAMADGLGSAVCLRFGLVNHDVAQNQPLYAKKFDILITNDGPVNDVLAVVRSVPA